MRKANWKKGMSIVLASAMVCGTTGITAFAQEETPVSALTGGAAVKAKEWNLVKEPKTVELSDKDKEQLSKEETVYVIANADGSPQKLIVSDWLKNAAGMREISDATELTDVSDVKGNLSFQKTNGNLGVWDSDGNDIYYQGSIQKALPVDMKVTYRLDGKNISPEELAGKSGKVTIRFDYDNRQKEKVKVGEKEEELYVPFVILTSLILDNDSFRNVEVSNGKIINDGERTIVVGYAMPGLKDNLDIQSEDFDIDDLDLADYVELTADVEDFELATTLTVATNEIFGDMDVDMQDKMDDLSDDMDELQDAMQQLMDGTSDLYDGVLELYDGTDELYDGMGELDDGAKKLKDGAKDLYDGTGSLKSGAGELVAGVNTLVAGLDTLNSKSSELIAGATQVYQALLAQANQVMGADPTIAAALNQVIAGKVQAGVLTMEEAGYLQAQMAGGLTVDNCGKVTSLLLKALDGTTRTALPSRQTEALVLPVQESDAKLLETPDMVEEMPSDEGKDSEETAESPVEKDSEGVKSEEEGSEDEAVSTEDGDGTEEEDKSAEEQVAEKETLAQDEEMVHADVQSKEVIPVQADAGEPAAQADFSGLAAQLKALAGYDSFYQGLKAYTAGVAQADQGAKALLEGAKKLSSGAGELRDGAKKLKDGANELKDGTQELKDGGQELKDGVVELRDGSLELKDGTVEFNDEGIQKLVDLLNGDIQELNDRFEATKEAAKAYKSFAGISDEMQGKVKFIYKTAAVEK